MPEKENIIGATHEFHSDEYARWWADRFEVTKERYECFDHLGDLLEPELNGSAVILELGTGPGYLATYLLNRFPSCRYHCLDYSEAMLRIAKERLEGFSSRVSFQQIDLTHPAWEDQVEGGFSAIVSTWALHDLESPENIRSVYRSSRRLLTTKGVLVNADFIKPDKITLDYEAGRILVSQHLDYLMQAGYSDVECTKLFETNLDEPASHNNYACMKGKA